MRILVLSDIHNNTYYAHAFVERVMAGEFDKVYLLGDIQSEAINIFNDVHEKVIAVKGNCDTSYDEEMALFNMPLLNYDYAFHRVIVLTHGHYYNEFNYDKPYDILLSGHTHRSELRKAFNRSIVANPGSIARPRDFFNSYMVIDETGMKIFDFKTRECINSLVFTSK